MMIGELARHSGLSVDTLRYYEKIGLVPPPLRDAGGRRVYDAAALRWLGFLERLKATGLGMRERIRYAELRVRPGVASVRERREMLEQHRDKVAADLRRLTDTLALLDDKVALYRRIESGEVADPVAPMAEAAIGRSAARRRKEVA
ncbi:MerR family transcriptional regulator [Stappia sp. TSB10GB4]|uniref:MerR family transcriptional regulator n=1 Tax=Stappia sp. TSB10GB4 TaxID=2003584 RepID=UPI00164974D5|nr:MerR family transcriptional regulator [Stappia sp. TSB10GB4]